MSDIEDKVYLRPMGIIAGPDSRNAIDAGFGLPLAGGTRAFTMLELIRRDTGGTSRRIVRITDRAALERLIGITQVGDLVEARNPIVGMDRVAPKLMGILNVTPDSFSDGGRFSSAGDAIAAGQAMCEAGAHLIDVGGESTRPGADPVSEDEELSRVLPVIAGLAADSKCPLSIDSRKAKVLKAAHEAGASLLNDVSALSHDPESLNVAAQTGAPVVLMHAKGEPKNMQVDPYYDDVLLDVYDFLEERVKACEEAGIPRRHIIIDPGFGFGKTLEHNLELLNGLTLFHGLGCLLLVGLSRKRFIGVLDRDASPENRLAGSLAAMVSALSQGVQIFRVHDVDEARQALRVFEAIAENQL